jgi:hypothetical protein
MITFEIPALKIAIQARTIMKTIIYSLQFFFINFMHSIF